MKKGLTRRSAAGIFAATALLLLTATAVWACTPQPRIFSLGPQVGPVGLEITLEGQAAGALSRMGPAGGGAPVEVRWNSPDGPKIGEGVTDGSGTFAVRARIPEAKAGIYFIMVKAGDAGVVRTPFEVTSERAVRAPADTADPRASSQDLWSAFSSDSPAVESLSAQRSDLGWDVQAVLGAGLLAAGVAGLALGFLVNRRRSAGRRTI